MIRLRINTGRMLSEDGNKELPLPEDVVIDCLSLEMLVENSGISVGYDAEYTGGFTMVPFTSKKMFRFDSEGDEE